MLDVVSEAMKALAVAEKWAEQDLPNGIGVMGKKHSPIAYVAKCIEKKVSFELTFQEDGLWELTPVKDE